ncbi:MAG: M50 family metallopeptidase [Anaerolineales bacterium]
MLPIRAPQKVDLLLAFGAFLMAFALWQFNPLSPVVYPLRLFVTFIHELGHGVAALATGGDFLRFEVQENGAGLAYSRGGWRPIVISAGYTGTALFGAALLWLANRAPRPQMVALGLGMAFALLTMFYAGLGLSNFNLLEGMTTLLIFGGAVYGFTLAQNAYQRALAIGGGVLGGLSLIYFAAGDNLLTVMVGLVSGFLLMLMGYRAPVGVTIFVLNFLAFAVGFNAISDAWALLQIVSGEGLVPQNDATAMADETALPAAFWAVLWMGLALLLMGGVIWRLFMRWKPNRA